MERADAKMTEKAIGRLKEIDKKIMNEPDAADSWTKKFMGGYEDDEGEWQEGMMDRVEQYGNEIFLSVKQCEMIERMHKNIVLGETVERTSKKPKNPGVSRYG